MQAGKSSGPAKRAAEQEASPAAPPSLGPAAAMGASAENGSSSPAAPASAKRQKLEGCSSREAGAVGGDALMTEAAAEAGEQAHGQLEQGQQQQQQPVSLLYAETQLLDPFGSPDGGEEGAAQEAAVAAAAGAAEAVVTAAAAGASSPAVTAGASEGGADEEGVEVCSEAGNGEQQAQQKQRPAFFLPPTQVCAVEPLFAGL